MAAPHQIVNHCRFRRQQRQHLRPRLGAVFTPAADRSKAGGSGSPKPRLARRGGGWFRRQVVQHVGGGFHQDGALPDQVIAAPGPRIERRAGNGEDLPPDFLGDAGGDQAAGPRRRLDHHHAQRQAGDDAVAAREVAGLRDGAERRFGDQQMRFGDARCRSAFSGG